MIRWQIWNEPNIRYFATPVSPRQYARLVLASSRSIRAIDRRANVMLAGLFARPRGSSPRQAMYATTFLRAFARRIGRGRFDSIALHPYSPNTSQLRLVMRQFRRATVRSGLAGKPLHITEIGWGSGPRTNAFLTGSQRAQARQLRSAFTYLLRNRRSLNLRSAYWFALKDAQPSIRTCNFCYSVGLFRWTTGTRMRAKPAWHALVRFTRGRP
jgi:polysaccharide biosynthesis protein PslG